MEEDNSPTGHERPPQDPINRPVECNYCKKDCAPPLRCTGCRTVYYCSKSCQRSHWKVHKQFCLHGSKRVRGTAGDEKKESLTVAEAARELSLLMGGISAEKASENYYRATDELERLNTARTNESVSTGIQAGENDNNSERKIGANGLFPGPNFSSRTAASQPKKDESLQKSFSDESRREAYVDNSIVTNSFEVSSRANVDTKEVIKLTSNNEGFSISTVPTYFSHCIFTIENLVNISTLNFTLIIPCDVLSTDHLSSMAENEKSTDFTKENKQFLQLEDIRLHINPMTSTSAGTNCKTRHRIVVSINSRSKLVGQLKSIAKHEKFEDEYVLASFCIDEEITTSAEDSLASLSITDGRYITFRLQYHQQVCSGLEHHDESVLYSIAKENELTDVNALSNIECRFCDNLLQRSPNYVGKDKMNIEQVDMMVSKDPEGWRNNMVGNQSYGIKNVLQLPNGNWDDITDYLVCYGGQPSLNFSSSATTASQGTALEDECTIVLHLKDIPNVCVLAIEGYGEEDICDIKENTKKDVSLQPSSETVLESEDGAQFRGSRAWKDNVGGATVCCAQCCSTLGYASIEYPETFRLLKHRLRACVDRNQTQSKDFFAKNTCGSFIGREIVQYAERQAVYTIVVVSHSDVDKEAGGLENSHHKKRRCLLLRLLSWNTKIAFNLNVESNKGNDLPEFRRVVKVIYEETDDMVSGPLNNLGSTSPSDWIWGGADLCCFPEGKAEQLSSPATSDGIENRSKASARIYLAKDEWSELKDSLREGAAYFSTTISKTTVLLKMGDGDKYRNTFLSMLHLPC